MLQCSIHEHDREAAPIIGAAVCCPCLVSPVLSWLMIPGFKRMLFAPARVPARFKAEYSSAMALRPSQIQATAVDGALMVPSVMRLHYRDLKMPVVIMAGHGDKVVSDRQAKRLQATIPGSELHIVEGVGHMVHHIAFREVAEAVADVQRRSGANPPVDRPRRPVSSEASLPKAA